MKVFAATLLVLVLAFVGIKMAQSPSVATVKAAQQENMTQFSSDLAKFMKVSAVKEGAPADTLDISAKCKPNQGAYHIRCWVNIKENVTGTVEKATAENVRRSGDKFVWDHES